MPQQKPRHEKGQQLQHNVRLSQDKILNLQSINEYGGVRADSPVLVILAAGKGTRFGRDPKCVQPVHGAPLARHLINAFRYFSSSPVIALVEEKKLKFRPEQPVSIGISSGRLRIAFMHPDMVRFFGPAW